MLSDKTRPYSTRPRNSISGISRPREVQHACARQDGFLVFMGRRICLPAWHSAMDFRRYLRLAGVKRPNTSKPEWVVLMVPVIDPGPRFEKNCESGPR